MRVPARVRLEGLAKTMSKTTRALCPDTTTVTSWTTKGRASRSGPSMRARSSGGLGRNTGCVAMVRAGAVSAGAGAAASLFAGAASAARATSRSPPVSAILRLASGRASRHTIARSGAPAQA